MLISVPIIKFAENTYLLRRGCPLLIYIGIFESGMEMKTHFQVAGWDGSEAAFWLELVDGMVHFLVEVVKGGLEGRKVRVVPDNLESCFLHKKSILSIILAKSWYNMTVSFQRFHAVFFFVVGEVVVCWGVDVLPRIIS